jgi:hypothetical protein
MDINFRSFAMLQKSSRVVLKKESVLPRSSSSAALASTDLQRRFEAGDSSCRDVAEKPR